MNKVSVVIPCYNAGLHLGEAIQSALAQTWPEVEIIIVDDGSSDAATLQILDEAVGPRVRIFRQPNAGPAAARNRAIREAVGDYILPLDADDTLEPTYVAKAVAALDAQPDVGIVYCKAMKFGAEQGPWELPPYTPTELVIGNVIFVSAMFRRSDWKVVGGFDEHLRFGIEDYDFWVKLVHRGREVVQLEEYLFNYRIREQSRTVLFEKDDDKVVAAYARIFRTNRDFYAEHAENLFHHRFALYRQLRESRDLCDDLVQLTDGDVKSPLSSPELARKRRRVAALEEALAHHVAAVASLQRDRVAHRQAKDLLDSELADLRGSLGQVLESRSWRLTRPLRVLGRLLRGEWSLLVAAWKGRR